MLIQTYHNLFGPDKLLRHLAQHILVAIIAAALYILITGDLAIKEIAITFAIFTFLPDIDGLSSLFIWNYSNPVSKKVTGLIFTFKFKEALAHATVFHKKLNRLMIHNMIFYLIFWVLIYWAGVNGYLEVSRALAAAIAHFTFDWLDDIKQLGHVNNWLWPFIYLMPKTSKGYGHLKSYAG